MIKFRDTENNTIHVKPDGIIALIEPSPLTKHNPQNPLSGRYVIVMQGINSIVSHEMMQEIKRQLLIDVITN